ncbi:unnamed protein product [Adineta steineri]|uniref:type I protein arginine methyltransferase n=1 Tax=Adineta steineri TaxID=433720 RepID=A0A818W2J5_9BILA|nr:unnamed protein product [Adineta steineri]
MNRSSEESTKKVASFEPREQIMDTQMKTSSSYIDKMAPEDMTSKEYYLDSTAHFAVHEELLKDEIRTKTFRNAIINNRHLFKDKVVLNIGCGIGIFSLFAAKAGAKMVIAVEKSNVIEYTKKIIRANRYDKVIKVIKGKIEEIELPEGIQQVDIIIAEWMGYSLFYDSIIQSVIYARDKYLKPDGIIFPDRATMYMVGIEDREYKEDKVEWWSSVYGYNMGCLKNYVMREPLVDTVDKRQICTDHFPIKTFDLKTMTINDIGIDAKFRLRASRDDYLHAFVTYFVAEFTACTQRTVINTAPGAGYTHWKQTVFYFPDYATLKQDEVVEGTFSCKVNLENTKKLNFDIDFQFNGQIASLHSKNQYFMKVSILFAVEQKFKIVCYFTNWAMKRPGGGSMTPEDIDPCLCTHVIYAFSEMDNNQLTPMEKHDLKDGSQPGFFERFNAWKSVNKNLKTLLAVGGWDMGMKDFAGIVKSEKTMKKFAESTVKYLRKHKFDGLDLDFEYPGVDWRDSPKEDKQKFTKMCEVLYATFEKEAETSGNERLLLTAAVSAAKVNIDKAYEVDKLVPVMDWFNLMTYDFHGAWDQNRAHHSSLNSKDNEKDDTMYIDFAVKYYQKLGMPPSKIMLGIGTYGRGDTSAMPYTGFKGESGFVAYYESCIQIVCEKMKETWDAKQLVPYIAGPYNQPKAGVENVRSMKYKANYIKQNNLGGAMIWTLDMDDFRGQFCCQGKFPLIKTIKAVLHGQVKLLPKEKICASCPTKEYKDFKPQTQPQTTEKTTKKPKKSKRDADTPTPEDVCEELKDGQWPDPSDCKSYFLCRGVGSQWGEQKREVCYTGAYFDPNEKTCKWIGLDKLNCEELVEGYENPVAGVTRSSNKGDDDDDDTDDDDSPSDAGTTKSKKESKGSSSSKSISILSRTTSEFETCTQEKAVEFDPVQDPVNESRRIHEQISQEYCLVDYPSAYRYQQQRRLHEYPSISEQSPPSYSNTIEQTGRQQLPLFSSIRTIPSTTYGYQNSPVVTPSIYTAKPPTYAEIFLTSN